MNSSGRLFFFIFIVSPILKAMETNVKALSERVLEMEKELKEIRSLKIYLKNKDRSVIWTEDLEMESRLKKYYDLSENLPSFDFNLN